MAGAPALTHPETGRHRGEDDLRSILSIPKGKGQQEETLLPQNSFLRKLTLSKAPLPSWDQRL